VCRPHVRRRIEGHRNDLITAGFALTVQVGYHGGNNKTNEGQMGRVFAGRILRAGVLMTFLASCGGGNFSAPRNLDDACALARERPSYFRAMERTEDRWDVPVPVQMAMIHQESKFIGNAQTPHRFALGIIPMGRMSSAYGYSQALDGTWEEYQQEQGGRRAQRDDIEDATDFMGWYMHETAMRLGIPKADAEAQYLAYHEGRTGYANESYLGKPWLVEVAAKVEARAAMYDSQLQACGRR
jgi:hypothetical protein